MNITPITLAEFSLLIKTATVIHSKNGRDRIFELADGTILKLFYGKNNLNRAKRRAKRFICNSQRLQKKDFESIIPISAYDCSEDNSIYIRYQKLPGTSLDALLKNNTPLLEKTAHFIYSLHQHGIYFRDLHPGNILLWDEKFYLIDVQNVNFHWLKVPTRRQIKNITTFLFNRSFKSLFSKADHKVFINAYAQSAQLNPRQTSLLMEKFKIFAQKRCQLLEW